MVPTKQTTKRTIKPPGNAPRIPSTNKLRPDGTVGSWLKLRYASSVPSTTIKTLRWRPTSGLRTRSCACRCLHEDGGLAVQLIGRLGLCSGGCLGERSVDWRVDGLMSEVRLKLPQ